MKKVDEIIIDDLKKKNLKKFISFVKKFYKFKILIDNKFYKSTIFNKIIMHYMYWNRSKSNYNFKIIKYKNEIILIHGYIPISKFDNKLDNKTIFLSLLIGSSKANFPLFPLSYSAITNNETANFVYFINPTFTSFLRYKKFQIQKMNHHFVFSKNRKKFILSNITGIKSNLENKSISSFKFLNEKFLKKLNIKNFYKDYIPLKSNEYLINRYLKHPFYDYSLVGCFDNKSNLKIILVTRELRYKNFKALRIIEIVGKNKDIIFANSALISLVKKYEFIDLYSYGVPNKILDKVGFCNIKNHPNIIIPDYFEPYLKKNNDLYCGFKSNLNNSKFIRLFKGDGDQDHPRSIIKN